MKVVLDTNVIVSRVIFDKGPSARILEEAEARTFALLVSEPILAEYGRVLRRANVRARHRWTEPMIAEQIDEFEEFGVMVEPSERVSAVENDPDDNIFLECAVGGEADYIVSGDAHLLALREFRGIHILSPAVFPAALKEFHM